MSTRNFNVNSTSGLLTTAGLPFGNKGAVVVKKGGSAQVVTPHMAQTNISNIGTVTNALN